MGNLRLNEETVDRLVSRRVVLLHIYLLYVGYTGTANSSLASIMSNYGMLHNRLWGQACMMVFSITCAI